MKPGHGAVAAAKELVQRARRSKSLLEAELDAFLAEDVEFDERVEALVVELGDVPLVAAHVGREDAVFAVAPRPRVPPIADDDNLRRYLREVHQAVRLEKPDEIRLAKRLEFTRRRFRAAVTGAELRHDHLREVLGSEFSRSCAQDLRLPRAATRETLESVAKARRAAIRARAAEMNRVRATFVEQSLVIVADLTFAYRTYGVPLMDLIQEGNGALIRAVEKFDWRKDVRFQTYATFWIRQAVERSIAFNKGIVRVPNYLQQKMRRLRREGVLPKRDREAAVGDVAAAFDVKRDVANHLLQTARVPFSLDATIDEEGETFASALEDVSGDNDPERLEFGLLQSRIGEVMGDLMPLERQILELRFGLAGQVPRTLEEVGRQMNVSRERIRQLQMRAIKKLQRPTLMRRLAGFT